jgi:Flp pilus assembly pilin Flp
VKRKLKKVFKDQRGVGVVEVILILVVLIALVLIFKSQLISLVNSIFETISNKAGTV